MKLWTVDLRGREATVTDTAGEKVLAEEAEGFSAP